MVSAKSFRCEVLTPEGPVSRTTAHSVVFPARDGQVGVLPGHSPMVAVLGCGELQVRRDDGVQESYYVNRGFARVGSENSVILAEECIALEQLDPEEAWEGIQEAQAMPVETDEQAAARDRALETARIKFRLAQIQRHGRRRRAK